MQVSVMESNIKSSRRASGVEMNASLLFLDPDIQRHHHPERQSADGDQPDARAGALQAGGEVRRQRRPGAGNSSSAHSNHWNTRNWFNPQVFPSAAEGSEAEAAREGGGAERQNAGHRRSAGGGGWQRPADKGQHSFSVFIGW